MHALRKVQTISKLSLRMALRWALRCQPSTKPRLPRWLKQHMPRGRAVTHVQTLEAARQALTAGTDGLAHIFVDTVPDESFVNAAVASELFVIATLAVFQQIGNEPLDTSIMEDSHLSPYLTASDLQTLATPYSGF